MAHLNTCRTYKELTGGIWVHHSDPDPNCNDTSHHANYTQENK